MNEVQLLKINNLTKRFGGVNAVVDFSMTLRKGQVVGIIGPNGAGKTTIFNLISGVYKPDAGHIFLEGHDITGLEQHLIARMGIGRTFQNIRLFKGLNVLENVMVAVDQYTRYDVGGALVGFTPSVRREEKRSQELAWAYLARVGLTNYADERPEKLPYGLQRKLEIARALAVNPKVLLLDEPGAGLNPKEVQDLITLVRDLNKELELTILLIEHRMEIVMKLCEYIYVQNFGRTLAAGTPGQIQHNEEVIKAYLGDES